MVTCVSSFVAVEGTREGDEEDCMVALEIGEWLSRATLDIVGEGAMGQKFDALHNPSTELNLTYRKAFKPLTQAKILAMARLFMPSWLVWLRPVKTNEDIDAATRFLRNTAHALLQSKVAESEYQHSNSTGDKDIISILLRSGSFTADALTDQILTFLVAGQETSTASATWTLYALCKNQDMQSRLREEIRANITSPEDNANAIRAECIDRLPYLRAVCNETLRLYPPIGITLRETVKDTTILGTMIPRGTSIALCPSAINTSTALWAEDAGEFKPERWLGPEGVNGGAVSNFAFLTFLHGKLSFLLHNCLQTGRWRIT